MEDLGEMQKKTATTGDSVCKEDQSHGTNDIFWIYSRRVEHVQNLAVQKTHNDRKNTIGSWRICSTKVDSA